MLRKVLIIIFAVSLLAACGQQEKKSEALDLPKTVQVKTVKVEKTNAAATRVFTGTASSDQTAFIIPKVVGYIEKVLVTPGQKINKGQLLVTIKSGELEDKYQFAKSSVQEAENGMKQAKIGFQMAQSQLKQAQANYDLADKTYKRYSNLIKNNSVSKQEFDQMTAKYDLAKQGLKIAEDNVNLASEKMDQVRLKKQQAESMMNEVKTYLSYTHIRAPFSGVVLEKKMDVGNLAAPGNPILKVGNDKMVVYTYVSQSLIKDIKKGTKATVTIQSLGEDFDSEVLEISPDVDVSTGNFMVKLAGCDKLYPGMFAKVHFITGEEQVISVPEQAVVKRGQLTMVFVDKDGRADMRIVKTGRKLGGNVEIIAGLYPGDIIVTKNAQLIKSGDILEAE